MGYDDGAGARARNDGTRRCSKPWAGRGRTTGSSWTGIGPGSTRSSGPSATRRPDLEGWAFLPAPSTRAFWARRQAHETSIHRADAQSCTEAVAPYDATFAADGVDELLFGFAQRRNDLPDDPPVLRLEATDVDRCWTARLGPERVEAATDAEAAVTPVADCTVRAPASDLYLLLWNRRTAATGELLGDRSVLDVWRGAVRVRWSE